MAVEVAGRPNMIGPRAAARAVRAEIAGQSRPLRAWLAVTAVLMLLGVFGAIASIVPGKQTFGTTPVVEWGLLIAAYVFFATMTSGLCLASSLGTVFGIERFLPLERRHAILALLSLVTAFGVIALDLHYPIRLVFGAVLSPSPLSPMWWMGVLYGVYLMFLLIEVWSMFRGHDRIHRVACTLSSGMAIAAPSTLGAVFGVMATRPFWHGAFTPASFLGFALLTGTSLLGIVFYAVHRFGLKGAGDAPDRAIPAIRLLLTITLGVVLFLTAWQTIIGFYGGVPGLSEATRALVVGPLGLVFWVLKIAIGLAIPLVLLVLPRTRTPAGLFVASCMAIAGAFADRFGFVVAGQLTPDTAASGLVSQPYAQYTPTIVEACVVLGAFGFIAFAYTMAERLFDLGHVDTLAHRGQAMVPAAAARVVESPTAEGEVVPARIAPGPEAVVAPGPEAVVVPAPLVPVSEAIAPAPAGRALQGGPARSTSPRGSAQGERLRGPSTSASAPAGPAPKGPDRAPVEGER